MKIWKFTYYNNMSIERTIYVKARTKAQALLAFRREVGFPTIIDIKEICND